MIERGNIIASEKESRYKLRKTLNIFSGSFMFGLGITVIIFLVSAFFGIVDPPLLSCEISVILIELLVFVFLICVCLWGGIDFTLCGLTRLRLAIYESGIVPYRLPEKYPLSKKDDYFIPWDNIAKVIYYDPDAPDSALSVRAYAVIFKNGYSILMMETYFENGDVPKFLKKMTEVDKIIKARGEIEVKLQPRRWQWEFPDQGF